ncbi:roquin-1a isoform X3 [Scleropages formosus]|uniref:roquin-1a isoform X3 n=1 Tax=Scleropages formosus TaxID=113540 RepID=UPI000878A05F|nr:roquin-1-like isoform X3 [Scleropages formosus]
MPVQAPQWTEFLQCDICTHTFEHTVRRPISLGCGHTVCKMCLNKLHRKACPFDQTTISTDIEQLPINTALLQLVGGQMPRHQPVGLLTSVEDTKHYEVAYKCVEELALYLKPLSNTTKGLVLNNVAQSALSRPMQRKLVTLVRCQLVEEEGRVRAMRAARSLGERTVTELILQHQNPQQLSSNLWAAVRARGCQFLGPAMQEEALKLVLLALEDGSALSRKVLVLFVVQRLEPRFAQASKTSIGHVVQLLYRASCFKVTKRDEDSSLMQLKEEFRTYEALRREHDSQIVQIAMEGGLRIAPDQWSSLLYGDQSRKSHMQSIIDKLQTPASFAQSVQELTIALQRTGDPANLNRLRRHLELLADIDPSPDAPPPTWDQLDQGLVAVTTVVHGLVDFIQNHSKKGSDQQQPLQHSKYKTYMCRDMKQKGGCPRGSSCTFAHSQDELEKYRKMNKRLVSRPSLSLTHLDELVDLRCEDRGELEGFLISRGAGSCDPIRRPAKMDAGSHSTAGSPPDSLDPVATPAMSINPRTVTLQRMSTENPPNQKQMNRGPLIYAQPEIFYPESHPPSVSQYEPSPYTTGGNYQYQSAPYFQDRYVRNPQPATETSELSMVPYQDPYRGSYMQECQYPKPQFPAMMHMYGSHYDGRRHPTCEGSQIGQSYPRRDELVRMSPVPVDVPHAHAPPPAPAHMSSCIRDSCNQPQNRLEYLHRRREEIMAQLEERKAISPLSFTSLPTIPHTFPRSYSRAQYMEENSQGFWRCHQADCESQYSPWSCDTIGSYISTKDNKAKDGIAVSPVEIMNVNGEGLQETALELHRRSAEAKDDDPIIPFGSLPTVSRFGAISRTSKTGFQTTGLMQAMALSHGSTSKHTTVSADFSYENHGGWGGVSCPQHQNMASQGHFSERVLVQDREQLKMELEQVNQQISQQTQMRGMEGANSSVLMQMDISTLNSPRGTGEWPPRSVSSEQLSLELHHVEREIGKRTLEIMENHTPLELQYKTKPTENGQPEHCILQEDRSMSLSEGSHGSSILVQNSSIGSTTLSSLVSKTSSLALSSELGANGSCDLQKNGVVHSCP